MRRHRYRHDGDRHRDRVRERRDRGAARRPTARSVARAALNLSPGAMPPPSRTASLPRPTEGAARPDRRDHDHGRGCGGGPGDRNRLGRSRSEKANPRQAGCDMRPETILATNTSSLDARSLATASPGGPRRSSASISSARRMRRSSSRSCAATETSAFGGRAGIDLARQLGKFGVIVRAGRAGRARGCSPGISARRTSCCSRARCLRSRCSDGRFRDGLGPFATSDLAGLDVGAAFECPDDSRSLVELGAWSKDRAVGYYRYLAGRPHAHRDPEVESAHRPMRRRRPSQPRPIDDSEIVERCVLAIVNEGAAVLDERLTIRASDIDVIWVDGYGFPRHRGGPMYYADQIGLRMIRERLGELERQHGERWRASSLLAWLAGEGVGFGTSGPTKEHPRQTE